LTGFIISWIDYPNGLMNLKYILTVKETPKEIHNICQQLIFNNSFEDKLNG